MDVIFHPCLYLNRYLTQSIPLRWRHNGSDSVSNHQPYDCLLNYLYRRRSKKPSKLRLTGLCVGNSPETGEFPAQMASNAENVSIWWRHHAWLKITCHCLKWLYLCPYVEYHARFKCHGSTTLPIEDNGVATNRCRYCQPLSHIHINHKNAF